MRRWILAVITAAGVAGGWTPGGHYPTGAGGVPAAVYDPLSGLVPYSMNIQVVGGINTNDVAVFTDRTGRYVRGTNLCALVGALTTETDEIALAALAGTNAILRAAITNEAALREAADLAGLQALYGTNAILMAAITNEAALRAAHTADTENPHQVTPAQIGAATTQSVAAVEAALAGYQSAAYWPPNATASSWFTFTTNANEITITVYNIDGGTDVIIPDYIDGWPVTTIGANAFEESGVVSIGGAGNVVTVKDAAFYYCTSLVSVSLPQVQTVGGSAFESCALLASVPLPQVQTVEDFAFAFCALLASVPLPQVQTVEDYAFYYCTSLTSLYFNGNAPTIGAGIFAGITENQVTNYVTNPTATGWGDELGGMPVVRLDIHGDEIYKDGLPVATEAHVAQAIAAIPEPDLSSRVAVSSGTATNLTTRGWFALPQSVAGTNLTYRLVVSNDVILAIGVWQ